MRRHSRLLPLLNPTSLRSPPPPPPLCGAVPCLPLTALSLLWFKRRLPRYATKFVEMCVVLCADHGPCVSGGWVDVVV